MVASGEIANLLGCFPSRAFCSADQLLFFLSLSLSLSSAIAAVAGAAPRLGSTRLESFSHFLSSSIDRNLLVLAGYLHTGELLYTRYLPRWGFVGKLLFF